MQKVIILKGLPASGKSSYAKEQVERSHGHLKRINKDDIRAMLDNNVYSKTNERFVLDVRDQLIGMALGQGRDVIVDDTNLNPTHEKNIRNLVNNVNGVVVEVKFFDVDVDECIRRDLLRPNSVGEKVIRDMYNKWLVDWKDLEYRKKIDGKPWIVICDLDGTLALMGDRNPYDASTCEQDTPNKPVVDLLNCLLTLSRCMMNPELQTKIVFVSGRSDKYRKQTENWLLSNGFRLGGIVGSELHMRSEGDFRKDSIVKREIFEQNIANQYNVRFILDDRNQVVKMWRELGLPVFQVNEGPF